MTLSTRPLLALALCFAACGGLGNPDDSGSASNFTTAVPPWMGTDGSGGSSDGASAASTGGASGSASGTPTSTTSGDSQTSDPSGSSSGPPLPKLDLPPPSTTGDEDKDKDEEIDGYVEEEERA